MRHTSRLDSTTGSNTRADPRKKTVYIWELRGESVPMTDYDMFLESFEDNCPGARDSRSAWMIDYEKLDGSDQDKGLETHAGRNSRIT